MEALIERWAAEQESLKQKLIEDSLVGEIQYIGGVDISFVKDSQTDACVCFVVLDYNNIERIVHQQYRMVKLTQPYIPGFLAFRECDHILVLLDELRNQQPELLPQVILVDGNGILHPRGCGLASHLGVVADIPTIGVAKNFLWIEDLKAFGRESLRKIAVEKLQTAGSYFALQGESGKIYGACLRATEEAHNPIYVSVGHKVSLEQAIKICIHCSRFRIPEPVRQADKISRHVLSSFSKGG